MDFISEDLSAFKEVNERLLDLKRKLLTEKTCRQQYLLHNLIL